MITKIISSFNNNMNPTLHNPPPQERQPPQIKKKKSSLLFPSFLFPSPLSFYPSTSSHPTTYPTALSTYPLWIKSHLLAYLTKQAITYLLTPTISPTPTISNPIHPSIIILPPFPKHPPFLSLHTQSYPIPSPSFCKVNSSLSRERERVFVFGYLVGFSVVFGWFSWFYRLKLCRLELCRLE